jgi:nitrogen fixation NifU-like protein
MAKNNFDFFQDHSLQYLDMALGSDRRALIKKPDGYGKRTGDCGDTVEFYLQVRQEKPFNTSHFLPMAVSTQRHAATPSPTWLKAGLLRKPGTSRRRM